MRADLGARLDRGGYCQLAELAEVVVIVFEDHFDEQGALAARRPLKQK